MYRIALFALVLATLSSASRADPVRNFRMGFTSWPYAPTEEAVNGTIAFLRQNGDIAAEQIDNGVPWTALITGKPWPEKFEAETRERAARWRNGPPVFLSTSILTNNRDAIAPDVATGAPAPLGERPFADPRVRAAYVAYCKRLIALFRPAYFAYAIETNEILVKNRAQAADYAAFIADTRRELKHAFPRLPIAQTVSIHGVLDKANGGIGAQRPALRALLKGDDFTGISYYPFMALHQDGPAFKSAFDAMTTLARGPFAVTETGEIAEPLYIRALNFTIPGSPELQSTYVESLLQEAEDRRFRFVIHWTHRDYDELLKLFPPELRELGATWLRTGLLTADGRQRPALAVWRKWLGKKGRR